MTSQTPINEIFGRPREGIHAARMPGDLAAADVAGTLVLAFGLQRFLKITYIEAAALAFGTGIVAHRIFGVRTTVDKWLFPNAA